MARRASSDRILSEADNRARIEEMAEYQKTHVDPRKMYIAKYLVHGVEYSENIRAVTQQAAVEQVKYNCSLVGWQPMKLEVTEQS